MVYIIYLIKISNTPSVKYLIASETPDFKRQNSLQTESYIMYVILLYLYDALTCKQYSAKFH